MSKLTSLIDKLEARLKAAKELNRILTEYPDLRETVDMPASKSVDGPRVRSKNVSRTKKRLKTTHYAQIRDFFVSNRNQWTGTTALRKATGLSRNSVARVVYKSHKDKFEIRDQTDAGETKLKDWRLKPSIFLELMEEPHEELNPAK